MSISTPIPAYRPVVVSRTRPARSGVSSALYASSSSFTSPNDALRCISSIETESMYALRMRASTCSYSRGVAVDASASVHTPLCMSMPPESSPALRTAPTIRALDTSGREESIGPALVQDRQDAREDLSRGAPGIDGLHRTGLRVRRLPLFCGEFGECPRDALVKGAVFLLHPVAPAAPGGARQSFLDGERQEDREIGAQHPGRQPIGSHDLLVRKAASSHLVRIGRQEEPVDEDDRAALERRLDRKSVV